MANAPTIINEKLAVGSFFDIGSMVYSGWVSVCVANDLGGNSPGLCHIPMIDGGGNSEQSIMQAIQAVQDYWSQGKRVFVCCRHGMNRSVLITAAVLVLDGKAEWLGNAICQIYNRRQVIGPRDDTTREVLSVVMKLRGML